MRCSTDFTCHGDVLDALDYTKHFSKLHFTHLSLLSYVATRKIRMTCGGPVCGSDYVADEQHWSGTLDFSVGNLPFGA